MRATLGLACAQAATLSFSLRSPLTHSAFDGLFKSSGSCKLVWRLYYSMQSLLGSILYRHSNSVHCGACTFAKTNPVRARVCSHIDSSCEEAVFLWFILTSDA